MRIKVIHVDVETVDNGKGRPYEKAEVLYESNGRKSSKNLMSFSNPSVFKVLKTCDKGTEFDVESIKDDKGYYQWTSVKPAVGAASTGGTSVAADKPTTTRSNFETPEERERRQRLIVRQSSLTNAIAILSPGAKAALDQNAVKGLAQDLVDWVFQETDVFDQPNDLDD